MLIGAIAAVDDGYAGYFRRQPGGSLDRMTQDDDIGVAFDDSANDSPFFADVPLASEKPITLPPRRSIADSKLSLVRVEGSKKSVARTLPLSFSA